MRNTNRIRRVIFLGALLSLALASSSSSSARKSTPGAQTPAASIAPASPERIIEYRSFSGAAYTLRAFDGRSVSYALPDAWLGDGGLSRQEIDSLVELTDLAYAHMAELSGGEPRGQGLLTVAVVSTGPDTGSGLVGAKGVEISPAQLTKLKDHLRAGKLPEELLHEMEHCFDVNNAYLAYWPDWRHAWTTFAITYSQVYSQSGSMRLSPADLLDDRLEAHTAAWDALGAGASWGRCVRDAACPGVSQNQAWAGFMLRFARAHGPEAVLRAFAYLREYRASSPAPASAEGKNDLLVKALAAGAAADINCELDSWRWDASAAARAEIASLYPRQNALCLDQDGDGFTPLTGDYDDREPATRPGADESANLKDDDCDGITDDFAVAELEDFPARPTPGAAPVSTPARVKGMAEPAGQDSIPLAVSRPGLLKVRMRGRSDFHGWVGLTSADGLSGPQAFYTLTSKTFTFVADRAGVWVLTVTPDAGLTAGDSGGSGAYDFTVEAVPPRAASASLSAAVLEGRRLHLVATVLPSAPDSAFVTHVRFWVSPYGFAGVAPVSGGTAVLDWPMPADIPPTVSLRAQPLKEAVPAYFPSGQVWFDTRNGEAASYATDLSVTPLSAVPSPLNAGDVFATGFEFSNNGPAAADNARINLTLDEGLSLVTTSTTRGTPQPAGGGAWSIPLGRVEAGEKVVLSVSAAASPAAPSGALSLTVVSDSPETLTPNNSFASRVDILRRPTPTPSPAPASFGFDSATYATQESCSSVSVRVIRSGSATGRSSVGLISDNGSATQRGDFTFVVARLIFEPGETEKSYDVLINEDGYAEGDEVATLSLTNPRNGTLGQGRTAELRIVDDTPEDASNPADESRTFVGTHYHDFLNRQSDPSGEDFWTQSIEACGSDVKCRAERRVNVSSAFFLSIEFQQTGYLVIRAHKAAFGSSKSTPRYAAFLGDQREIREGVVVGHGDWQSRLELNKRKYLEEFVSRPEFVALFPQEMSAGQFVDKLFANSGADPTSSERDAAVNAFGAGDVSGRASALKSVSDSDSVYSALYNPSFVLMQYFGYLRRNPDDAPNTDFSGYDFWLDKMNGFSLPGESVRDEAVALRRVRRSEMVRAFIESIEYRGRFSGSADGGSQQGGVRQTGGVFLTPALYPLTGATAIIAAPSPALFPAD